MPQIAETKHGRFLVLPNDALGQALLNKGDFESHFYNVAKNVVKFGDTCIDCGANLGYHTVTLSKLVGANGKVLSFEPLRVIFQQLSANVFFNDLRNVFTLNCAIGDQRGVIQMDYVDIDNRRGVNIGGTKVGTGGDMVEMVKLDNLAIENVSFIKIDVQGSEVMLLRGAEELIKKSRPIMFVEVENNWLNCFGETSETLLNKLMSLDYILIRINTEYPCDHVAVPREKKDLIPAIVKDLGHPYDIIDGKSISVQFDRDGSQRHINYGSYQVNQ
jgi:hypothetical protein